MADDAAHKTPRSAAGSPVIRAGPSTSPRTSSSWLNAVEGFFAKLTPRRLKHGIFNSVVDLQAAINRFVDEHNQNPVRRATPRHHCRTAHEGSKR